MTSRAITEPTNARSRRTRAQLLGSARAILEEEGFPGLTIAAVAERAGVTRRTVYLHFGTRSELVAGLFDEVARTEGLHDSLRQVWAAPDAVSALREWAAHLARYHPRLLAVDRAMQQVWRQDPDAAAHRRHVKAEQRRGTRRLAKWLQSEGKLAEAWTVASAGDMLFALISSDMVEALLVDRRWSRERMAQQLAVLLVSTFTREQT